MKKTKAKLIKIESNHNRLTANEARGFFYELPQAGERFQFFFDVALTEGLIRKGIDTSPVVETMQINDGLEFKTMNSTYRLEDLEEVELSDSQEGIMIRGTLH